MALVAFSCLLTPAWSMVVPADGRTASRKDFFRGTMAGIERKDKPATVSAEDFEITAETEVFLDGRECAYEKVPDTATISRLELGRDERTIVRVYFRTRK